MASPIAGLLTARSRLELDKHNAVYEAPSTATSSSGTVSESSEEEALSVPDDWFSSESRQHDWVDRLLGSFSSQSEEEEVLRKKKMLRYDTPTLLRYKESMLAVPERRLLKTLLQNSLLHVNSVPEPVSTKQSSSGSTEASVTPSRERQPWLDIGSAWKSSVKPQRSSPIVDSGKENRPPISYSAKPDRKGVETTQPRPRMPLVSLSERHQNPQTPDSVNLYTFYTGRSSPYKNARVIASPVYASPSKVIALPKPIKAPKELDDHRLSQREKQISYGYQTVGYARYSSIVQKTERKPSHPLTPKISQKCSKRCWDGQVRKWRRDLHEWDPPESEKAYWESLIASNQQDSSR